MLRKDGFEKVEERKWCVYCHTNKINGKKYIGITSNKPKYRWNNGKGYRGQTHFYNAIKSHGWDGFEHEVLFKNLTEQEAKDMEIKLISEHNTTSRDSGYNMTFGGDGMLGLSPSKETREKLSILTKGKNNPFYGKKHTQDAIKKISEANIKSSKETREKRRIPRLIKIVQLDNHGNLIKQWASASDIQRELGYNNSNIIQCCRKRKSCINAYGFKWMYLDEYLNKGYVVRSRRNNKKKVILDDIVFNSIKECSNYCNCKRISSYLTGYYKTPQKYIDRGLRYYNPDTDKDLPIYVDTSLEV